MINQKMKVFALALLVLSIGEWGCKKQKCFNCANWWGSFKCYKGTDTVREATLSKKSSIDSLTKYNQLGYRCDTGQYHLSNFFVQQPICEEKYYKVFIANGDTCSLITP